MFNKEDEIVATYPMSLESELMESVSLWKMNWDCLNWTSTKIECPSLLCFKCSCCWCVCGCGWVGVNKLDFVQCICSKQLPPLFIDPVGLIKEAISHYKDDQAKYLVLDQTFCLGQFSSSQQRSEVLRFLRFFFKDNPLDVGVRNTGLFTMERLCSNSYCFTIKIRSTTGITCK